ncbi:hypothetical protein GCM10022226_37530 [Sphaerisporangium flaviroseum]|uniref:HNH domain-containing protein n=1 Tax=Sphaerisporangium flaviroseum TaxID=509199 RepID=A0ABP7IA36_9ACTN
MTLIILNGEGLADLSSYLPGEQPADLATLDELCADGLWPEQEDEPEAWLVWPAEDRNGHLHLPLYRRDGAQHVGPPTWLINYLRQEAVIWAGDVLRFKSSAACVAVKTSHCCGRAIDIAVVSAKGRVLFDQQLKCPCERALGPHFADIAEKLLEVVLWDNKRRNSHILVGWGMRGVLALTAEIRLLSEHPERRLRRWGWRAGGIKWEDAQTWDLYWRCDSQYGGAGYRRFVLANSTAVDECRTVLDRVRQMAKSDLMGNIPVEVLSELPTVNMGRAILLPIRLGRDRFLHRSERAQYRYLCELAGEYDRQGIGQRMGSDQSSDRRRSSPARRAVLIRCKDSCENFDCENPGFPSDTAVGGGPILDVDHIDDYARGGRDHPDTMIALCPNCHAVKTRGRSRDILREKLRKTARERHLAWWVDAEMADVTAADPKLLTAPQF